MRLGHLLLRQWRNRPGRALATAASVAVAVGAVVATWISADASRTGYGRLAETLDGVPVVDVTARGGGRCRGAPPAQHHDGGTEHPEEFHQIAHAHLTSNYPGPFGR